MSSKKDIINYLIAFGLIFIAYLLFNFQNVQEITGKFLFWDFKTQLANVLLAAVAACMLLFALVTLPITFRKKTETRANRNRIKELEKKLEIKLLTAQELEAAVVDTTDSETTVSE